MVTLLTYSNRLVRDLRHAIRKEAAMIPDFKEGAIVLSFVIKSEDANEYFGRFSDSLDYDCNAAVSGASGEEDERCALAARRALNAFADIESTVYRHWFILGPE